MIPFSYSFIRPLWLLYLRHWEISIGLESYWDKGHHLGLVKRGMGVREIWRTGRSRLYLFWIMKGLKSLANNRNFGRHGLSQHELCKPVSEPLLTTTVPCALFGNVKT